MHFIATPKRTLRAGIGFIWFGGISGVRSVANAECRKRGVWKIRSVENEEFGK